MDGQFAKLLLRKYCHYLSGSRLALIGCRPMCSTRANDFDVEKYYIRPDVQGILKKITGFNVEKIYREQKISDIEPPKYKLLTTKQLEEFEKNAVDRGQDFLQMPPVKTAWLTKMRTISVDDIANFEKGDSSYVFTDITYGLQHRQRVVVIRQSDGTLRWGSRDEHDRILHVYYPRPGKMYSMPKMFEEEHLEKVLGDHRYEYVLNRACIQFEPDDPNYIRVSQRTYEHLANHGRFDDLRSTRHFGPMAFYLAIHGRIDGLLVDMLQQGLFTDAVDVVKLFHILHSKSKSAVKLHGQQQTDPEQIIRLYASLDAANGGAVELALQSYNESRSQGAVEQKQSTSAS